VAEVRSKLEVTIWSYELFALALILTLILLGELRVTSYELFGG
jgi:hypothetical protein